MPVCGRPRRRPLGRLDAACQAAALAKAHLRGIRTPLTLIVNGEPDVRRFASLPPVGRDIRGVVEITERMLTGRLPELLPAVQAARDRGWRIALDDVGVDTRSLALMPLLRPDVIELDLRLVQAQPTPAIAAIAGAVGAQAERTGATVIAEGIENVSLATGWVTSVTYVSALSLWALVSGHWSAWQAARVEVNQDAEARTRSAEYIPAQVVEQVIEKTTIEAT